MTGLPPWLLILVLSITFTAVMAAGQAMYWAWVNRREREQEELLRRLGSGTGPADDTPAAAALFRDQAQDAAASALGQIGDSLQQTLRAADAGYSVSNLLTRMLILGASGSVLGLIFLFPFGIMLGAVGFLPLFAVRQQARNRLNKLVEQLPDSLELIARALSAGVGLSDAFRMVQEEMPMPIAAEFGRVQEEVRYGRDYREAFEKMLERNPGAFDLRIFVSSVMLQRDTGGNLIEILENISDTIRNRFLFDAKVRAMTSEARFSALILGSLPIGVVCILLFSNREYLDPLYDTFPGNVVVLTCVVMYSLGILIMRDISNVEV